MTRTSATTEPSGTAPGGPPRYHHRRLALGLFAGGVAGTLVVCALFLSSLETELQKRRPSKLIVDRRGELLGEVPAEGEVFGYWSVPTMLPERIATATIETEDRHFYEHGGIRWSSVARAVKQNLAAGRVVSGASTIAMQVARMQSGRPRGLSAKIAEGLEALFLVDTHGHDEVLRQYLTLAPYGNRVHGAARAARAYFDKPVEDLSWLQAAYLAALPQAPARMNPWTEEGRERGVRRARRILTMLHARKLITTHDLEVALASDLGIIEKRARSPEAIHAALAWSKRAASRDGVIQQATLDLEIQEKTAAVARRNLENVRERGATNTAAVVVDLPTGDVLAYVGSADYFDAAAHGAIDFLDVKRSPGSTLKPFLYGLALESGQYTAASPLPDTPMDFVTEAGRSYLPKNINRSFLGPMLLREALANSRNIPALRVLEDVGIEPALSLFEKGGVREVSFEPGRYGLGLALGNLHTTALELAGLYRALGDGGIYEPLRFFVDESADRAPRPVRLLESDTAALLKDILSDPAARQPSFPPGSALDYEYAVATKTGTSQGFRDGWTIAVSDRLVIVVWVGNHDWRRMNHLGGLAGTAVAAHELMDALMPLRSPHRQVTTSFPPPAGYKTRQVCALSGKLAGPECPHRRSERFRPGTEPFSHCDAHLRARIDVRNGLLATSTCPAEVVQERPFVKLPSIYGPWARQQQVQLLPEEESPLCGGGPAVGDDALVALVEPRGGVRYTWDPDTPAEFATIRLRADVEPRSEEIVFLVDGTPVAKVGYPHEARWTLTPGRHTIQAAFARRAEASAPVAITVRP